ncbi:MAG: transketolase [Mycoplasmatota bacterium]
MEQKIIANIKSLGLDMIDKAQSGHPGIVLGAANIIYTIYANHLRIDVNNPNSFNRDRFVMSAGHGSALLYATLYMSGFDLNIEDLKSFRKLHSKTPGHPEINVTPGVDMSTGPLGQGVATSVGMAIAQKKLNSKNKNIDFNVYTICGDGDLMEGVSHEAISLAGTLKLDNLILLYDSNSISLDSETKVSFNENIKDKFLSCNWDVIVVKKNTVKNIDKAIKQAKKNKKPTLIEVKTIIGEGSVLENTNKVHGKVLSKEDITSIKNKLKIKDVPFFVDEEARNYLIKKIKTRNVLEVVLNNDFDLTSIDVESKTEATRETNYKVMQEINKIVPNLFGGSADLSSSTKAYIENGKIFSSDNYNGDNIFFGVREHAMGTILNGLALCGFKSYGSTFLVFSDYLKPSIRLAALMNLSVTNIFTHDSISVGEDGPTHQPIEQIGALREIPNHFVFRPADKKEIIGCWNYILKNNISSSIILSRQNTVQLDNTVIDNVSKGGYVLEDTTDIKRIIISTGTDLAKAQSIALKLGNTRVVSMPCVELFEMQDESYKKSVLLDVDTYVIESSSSHVWYRYAKEKNIFNIKTFGTSAPSEDVYKEFNLNIDFIYNKMKEL